MGREIIGDAASNPVSEIIVKRAIDQMHLEAVEQELKHMTAGKVEELKEAFNAVGDIRCLAHVLWADYGTRHK